MEKLVFLGIIFCPIFTLGCVLVHYGHPFLGIMAFFLSIIQTDSNDTNSKQP